MRNQTTNYAKQHDAKFYQANTLSIYGGLILTLAPLVASCFETVHRPEMLENFIPLVALGTLICVLGFIQRATYKPLNK
jgi:hypothetical protein